MFPFLSKHRECAPASQQVRTLLLASEGRRFPQEAIDLAVRTVRPQGGRVQVLTIARLWGTGLGLPNPGLRPNKQEMGEQQENVSWALQQLEEAGVEADGQIVVTRNPCRSIAKQAKQKGCDAIIMGADPKRNWLVGGMMWSQEPNRLQRKTKIPVYLVCSAIPT